MAKDVLKRFGINRQPRSIDTTKSDIEPSFGVMQRHNSKVTRTICNLLDLGSPNISSIFKKATDLIESGDVTQTNFYTYFQRSNIVDLYFRFIKDEGLFYYDLQGSQWESFFEVLDHVIDFKLKNESKLAKFLLRRDCD